MGKTIYTSLQDFGDAFNADNSQGSNLATAEFTGNQSKNVSVEHIISNNLFLFKFEREHLQEYLNAYRYYRTHNVGQKYGKLQSDLRDTSIKLMDIYSVNPIECMLYASKTIGSSLSDLKLLRTITDVVKMLFDRLGHNVYTQTIFHIIRNWGKWEPQIKICIMASSKSQELNLVEYIFTNFFDNPFYKVEVFNCILDSKIELFIPTILEIIYKLNPGEEIDRMIGNEFDRKFQRNFHEYDIKKYAEMLPLPKHPYILRKLEWILGISKQDSFDQRMKLAKAEHEKKKIIDEAISALKSQNQNKRDIISVLRLSGIEYAGYSLLTLLNDAEFKLDKWEPSILIDCIMCFAYLKYSRAVEKINELSKNRKLKGITIIALCILGEVDVEVLIRNFILETDKEVINSYTRGFGKMRGDTHFAKQVREELIETFRKVLATKNENLIGTSIRNILTLIIVDLTYYPFNLFAVIDELFGLRGQSQPLVKIQDQLHLLEIVHRVINDKNKHRYCDFLHYVEKGNVNITETVKQKANTIINDKYPPEPLGTT